MCGHSLQVVAKLREIVKRVAKKRLRRPWSHPGRIPTNLLTALLWKEGERGGSAFPLL